MTDKRSPVELILVRLAEIIERLARVESQGPRIAEDVDGIDRALRPFGDGSKLPRRR